MFKKLLLTLIIAISAAIGYANSPIIAQLDNYVYLTQDFRKALCDLHAYAPDHSWSENFKKYCTAATENKFLAPFELTAQIVAECLTLDEGSCCDIQLKEVFTAIDQYRSELESGDAHVEFEEGFSDETQTRKHCKVFCKLIVTQCLVVNGVDILDCCLNSVTNGANIGGGAEVFADKTGTTLEFRTLVAGTNITLTQMASTITIAATGTGTGDVSGINTATCPDAVARFPVAGSNSINNAPLQALDLATTTQNTSPLLANDCVTTNINLALVPKGTGALVATVPDGTNTGGNARGTNAVDLQMGRSAANQVASGNYSVISGGQLNQASGYNSTVGGGLGNVSAGAGYGLTTIGGGKDNTATGYVSTIGGGFNNTAAGGYSFVGGGGDSTIGGNQALGEWSTIGGGSANTALGDSSIIGGGYKNTASVEYATIAGGFSNTASGYASTIGGGEGNSTTLTGTEATIGGGYANIITGKYATIGGGANNRVFALNSTIGGGNTNIVSGVTATIGGGQLNIASGLQSTIGGGASNNVSAQDSIIGGGFSNVVTGTYAAIGGGYKNTASGYVSFVGGGQLNQASGYLSTVGGGGSNVSGYDATTIGGGQHNTATGYAATICGGFNNTAAGGYSFVGGGGDSTIGGNQALGEWSTIGGGVRNTASGYFATIGGGHANSITLTGTSATIPGGYSNIAAGRYSFAAGQQAQSNHDGSFVWNDSTTSPVFTSSAVNQVRFHASGGFQIFTTAVGAGGPGAQLTPGATAWSATSDRNRKTNFKDVDGVEILNKLMEVPISSWNYKHQEASIRHIGPMAQDFNPAFGFTESALGISTLDFDGVALAAIQGLCKVVQENKKEHEIRISKLEKRMQK